MAENIDFKIIEGENGEKIYMLDGRPLDKDLVNKENKTFVRVIKTFLPPNPIKGQQTNWVYEHLYDFDCNIIRTTYTKIHKYWHDKDVYGYEYEDMKKNYIIYILTTDNLLKDRKYIIAITSNLFKKVDVNNKFIAYNKKDKYRVIYTYELPDWDILCTVQKMVVKKLKKYSDPLERHQFILPEDQSIDFFIDTIKKSVDFLEISPSPFPEKEILCEKNDKNPVLV